MASYVVIKKDELYHHGIKGQKWGVRRFQNKDGTLTEAGKKRYAKELYNEVKSLNLKNSYSLREHKDSNAYNAIKDVVENRKDLADAFEQWKDLSNKLDKIDFWNSKEKEAADIEAYQNTYDWFKKHDPDYLKEIESKTDDLLWAHDFRKTYEGYQDEAWSKAEKEFNKKHPEYLQLKKQEDEKLDKYISLMKDTTTSITRKYGDKTIKSIDDKGYMPNKFNDVVESTIGNILWERIKTS